MVLLHPLFDCFTNLSLDDDGLDKRRDAVAL